MGQAVARWFWSRDGKQGGPISWDELQTMARSGKLRGNDLVWREGSPNWQPACTARSDDAAPVTGGAPDSPVHPFVSPALNDPAPQYQRPARPSAARHLVAGTLWLAGGITLTAFSYMGAASSPHGGHYRTFYGAIVVGIIQFFRAISAASGD